MHSVNVFSFLYCVRCRDGNATVSLHFGKRNLFSIFIIICYVHIRTVDVHAEIQRSGKIMREQMREREDQPKLLGILK